MSLFKIENINLSYGKKQVLFDLSLPELNEGEILGLLGPNAAGKSTLMQAMSAQAPFQGQVQLNGKSISETGHQSWHTQVSYMPQTPPQLSSLLPYELMWSAARAMSLELSDEQLELHIESLFNRLGLSSVSNAPLYSLSGGKRQLVGLALALIRDPTVLLLDEPTSALDLHWRLVVLDYVRERVSQQGGGAIAALHDLDLAARYCDKLVLIDEGKVIASGTPFEVLTQENLAAVYQVDTKIIETDLDYPLIQVIKPIRQT